MATTWILHMLYTFSLICTYVSEVKSIMIEYSMSRVVYICCKESVNVV